MSATTYFTSTSDQLRSLVYLAARHAAPSTATTAEVSEIVLRWLSKAPSAAEPATVLRGIGADLEATEMESIFALAPEVRRGVFYPVARVALGFARSPQVRASGTSGR